MKNKEIVGIYVSKNTLDVYLLSTNYDFTVMNSPEGFAHLIEITNENVRHKSYPPFFCFENTGRYSRLLSVFLEDAGFDFVLLHALDLKRSMELTDSDTFIHKDYGDNARHKPITISGTEFLRRFCLHILPHRFVKIRHYGIYSSRARALKNKQGVKMKLSLKPRETVQQRMKRLTGFDLYQCPFCKQGTMHIVDVLPRIRSPGNRLPFCMQNQR
jgi:hypothetical protein